MERKDFIEQVGLSSAAILIFGCMQSCSKSSDMTSGNTNTGNNGGNAGTGGTNTQVDFTINIAIAPYTSLNTPGGFYVDSATGIIIARTLNSDFLAVSSICTHQGSTIEYQANANRFFCAAHGSAFDTAGTATVGPAKAALKQYKTSLTGSNLRVYA
jgi:cytochrome b6-f complex iron-sulfur subunit